MSGPSNLALVGALASVGSGAIAAALAGAHGEHRAAVVAFVLVGVFQIGWGGLMLRLAGIRLALVGAVGNTAALAGWLLTKTSGIGFIDGLDAEGVRYADALAATLTAAAVLLALAWVLTPHTQLPLGGLAALVMVALVVPAMVQAGGQRPRKVAAAKPAGADTQSETRPFDPKLPIDLSGMPGVTPEQQARAENLLAVSLARLPQFGDPDTASKAGYRSIGDELTGEEHYVNWSLLDDGRVLDADHPEALVYRVGPDRRRTLEAAMFMLAPGSTWDDVPDIGGALTQWHIHDNLCLTDDPVEPKIASVTGVGGPCSPPLVKLAPTPMIHVWIVPNRCGPFAALNGIGAGQVQAGEERLCDHVHGSPL